MKLFRFFKCMFKYFHSPFPVGYMWKDHDETWDHIVQLAMKNDAVQFQEPSGYNNELKMYVGDMLVVSIVNRQFGSPYSGDVGPLSFETMSELHKVYQKYCEEWAEQQEQRKRDHLMDKVFGENKSKFMDTFG